MCYLVQFQHSSDEAHPYLVMAAVWLDSTLPFWLSMSAMRKGSVYKQQKG
uniref:Uncharacterized protein n=1 Tax=Anguilla anguilla TaxID=7936 RepID=A0A0E9UH75_ANGAN